MWQIIKNLTKTENIIDKSNTSDIKHIVNFFNTYFGNISQTLALQQPANNTVLYKNFI